MKVIQTNPIQLDEISASSLSPYTVTEIKKVDCTYYNKCLDKAIAKNWAGFSCQSCQAYESLDYEQRVSDCTALIMAYTAAGYVHELGNAHRVPGTKPGY